MPGSRIWVVGTSGSGKTTTAALLAEILDHKHVELDALHWGPNWSSVDTELMRSQLKELLAGDEWVVDGNYGKMRDIVSNRCNTVVWLDYSLFNILSQLILRTAKRIVFRQELWSHNRETLRKALSKDSIILWSIQTYRRRRLQYGQLQKDWEQSGGIFVRLCSPKMRREWLGEVRKSPGIVVS